jgi:hypothetical protein
MESDVSLSKSFLSLKAFVPLEFPDSYMGAGFRSVGRWLARFNFCNRFVAGQRADARSVDFD